MPLPEAIQQLADKLAELPSIGPRQAIRLAFFLVSRGKNEVDALASAIDRLKHVKICSRCFFVHETRGLLCEYCENPKRAKGIIAIIEKETDLISIENTHRFTGSYFILGPIHKTGILEDWQKLRLQQFKTYVQKDLNGKADEIILAFNPSAHGDFSASLIAREFAPLAKKISRLGRGLPTGGEIEFADDETLGSALDKRS
jgi:recombination protein RecR